MSGSKDKMRIAAVGDIHYTKTSHGALVPMFAHASQNADVLLLCGDLTDYGTADETHVLVRDLTSSVRIPIIAVLGNHDFESDRQDEMKEILSSAGVRVLDGDSVEIDGVGFAGVKGFAGGFGRRALGAWGEQIIKQFVHEAVQESLKLEAALAKLRTPQKVAVLHYSPIQATVVGEPPEIMPFLGSSRLEEPLLRYRVNVVFHGHAHRGTAQGFLKDDVPVYNVAMALLQHTFPGQHPVRIVEIPREVPDPVEA